MPRANKSKAVKATNKGKSSKDSVPAKGKSVNKGAENELPVAVDPRVGVRPNLRSKPMETAPAAVTVCLKLGVLSQYICV